MSLTEHGARALKRAEGLLSRGIDDVARREGFLRPMGGLMRGGFRAKALSDRMMEQWLRAWSLPVASDIAGLSAQVEALGRRLERLEERGQ